MDEEERELACYVLAYLTKHGYSRTVETFMQECSVLSSGSSNAMLVLPQTPLMEIVRKHKAQQATEVLVNTLGGREAWNGLWSKIDSLLLQIKSLYNSRQSQGSKVASSHAHPITPSHAHSATTPIASSHAHPTTTPSASSHAQISPPLPMDSSYRSPRRKRLCPQRKAPALQQPTAPSLTQAAAAPSSSTSPATLASDEDVMQVIEGFLGHTDLPEKLAGIINRCVERPHTSGAATDDQNNFEISAESLESIISLTSSDPGLDWLLRRQESEQRMQGLPPSSNTGGAVGMECGPALRPVEVRVMASNTSSSENLTEPDNKLKLKENEGSGSVSDHLAGSSATSTAGSGDIADASANGSASHFPAEVDLEKFLDCIHYSSRDS